MADSHFSRSLLAPRHWLSWLLLGLWWLLAQLPWRAQMGLARALSPLLALNKRRVQMARINVELCFPHWSEQQRETLLRENRIAMAKAVMEVGIAWFWPRQRLLKLCRVKGLDHLTQTRQDSRGVLLLSLHFTTMDLGGAVLGQLVECDGMYTPHRNPVVDYLLKSRRQTYSTGGITIPRENVRTLVQRLRQARVVWYAPDRDMGAKGSVFVPFFGVPAATITATAKLAQMGRALVIPFTQQRVADGYEITIHPPFANYPTGDDHADARRVNAFIEEEIRKCPEQYFWAQPRFKTRPEGEAAIYPSRAQK